MIQEYDKAGIRDELHPTAKAAIQVRKVNHSVGWHW